MSGVYRRSVLRSFRRGGRVGTAVLETNGLNLDLTSLAFMPCSQRRLKFGLCEVVAQDLSNADLFNELPHFDRPYDFQASCVSRS